MPQGILKKKPEGYEFQRKFEKKIVVKFRRKFADINGKLWQNYKIEYCNVLGTPYKERTNFRG